MQFKDNNTNNMESTNNNHDNVIIVIPAYSYLSRMFPDGRSSNVIWVFKGNGYIMFPQ